ncbi:MAG TPA: nitrous oxide reductase accessory protein NosL [Pricia sp.]|nr:nitrous oxide reductase accessory protein NosL [Pricia sp.]
MKRQVFFLMVLLLLSCNISPEPIQYGSDGCHYCSMTIVDRQHAAQFVTEKGRAYKFDAIECMMNHFQTVDGAQVALFRVNAYEFPGELIDATEATYLISRKIPSPMGEFLSAFGKEANAEQAQREKGGDLYTWQELKERFKKK